MKTNENNRTAEMNTGGSYWDAWEARKVEQSTVQEIGIRAVFLARAYVKVQRQEPI